MKPMSNKRKMQVDLTSFLTVLLMTIGCLVMLLICDTFIVVSNPDNIKIVSLVRGGYEEYDDSEGKTRHVGLPRYGNIVKDPRYVDVYENRLVIYPEAKVVPVEALEEEGNAFEQLLYEVEQNRHKEYIILILRPGASRIGRFIRRVIKGRGIDVGEELYELGRDIPAGLGAPGKNAAARKDEQKKGGTD
jgi:hypothetical protein